MRDTLLLQRCSEMPIADKYENDQTCLYLDSARRYSAVVKVIFASCRDMRQSEGKGGCMPGSDAIGS